MSSISADWRPSAGAKRDGVLSSVRPGTLLVATGIVLISGLLIVTGLIAGGLRAQALATTERELVRLDVVLAEASNRNFRAADAVLQAIADRLGRREPEATAAAMASPDAGAALAAGVGAASPLAMIALVGRNGAAIDAAGSPAVPADIAARGVLTALSGGSGVAAAIGAPIAGAHNGTWLIPVARRIVDRAGATQGYVVGALPAASFETLFGRVPLGADGMISLVRRDGTVLARYPERGDPAGPVSGHRLGALLAGRSAATVSAAGPDGESRIEVVQPLAEYPASILVSRSETGALGGWARQALLFTAFALLGAFAIAAMLYLIARQVRIHAALRAEKIEMEHARLVTEAELLKKDRLSVLGQLTATVAHELRNPLSAIRNTLFSLKEMTTASGLKLDRPISRMERSIERCNRIIGDLLEYARTRELRCAPVAFDQWLADVVAEQNLPASVAVVEDYRCGAATALIDGERIRRVVINLIDNAAQALAEMPADGGEPRIVVRTRLIDGSFELAIEDTGPGIPAENLGRIFEPLFSTKSFGTGLGLSTVKQIVGQHGGNVEVQSEVGRGTCFTVRLPFGEEAKVAA